ncbi:NADP-dependent oxidoreductase domain-containing protein, partial [Baffinella frigidus]
MRAPSAAFALLLALYAASASAFVSPGLPATYRTASHRCHQTPKAHAPADDGAGEKQGRRAALRRMQAVGGVVMVGEGLFGGLFGAKETVASTAPGGRTNDVVGVVNGIKQKLLGGSGIVVSEVGLGTQRWVSADFNAPDEREVFRMMDLAIRDGGVNLIDTAEQYPIPSDDAHPEGLAEATIGKWLATDKALRAKTVIATKIGGGQRISGKNIITACEDSLRRLGTDYIDVYQFHWPARYTPQSNWGQSLSYRPEMERRSATWEEQCIAMDKLYREGKIRGWGSCNDNAFGLTMLAETARRLGTVPPCSFQNDFSVLNRRTEQDGLAEASRPQHANAGFMAYNCLAGGVLTGKYLEVPAAVDDFGANPDRARLSMKAPRGRMDDM